MGLSLIDSESLYISRFGNDTNELNNIASLEAGAKVSTCVQVLRFVIFYPNKKRHAQSQ